ncbi:formate dehydrogenase major subunit [Desulfitispora alkaliphila]
MNVAKKVSRRGFLKGLGITTMGTALATADIETSKAYAKEDLKIQYGTEKMTVCPYCGVGCGILVFAENNKVIYVEGDPDNPINEGALCAKGSSINDMSHVMQNGERVESPNRLKKVLYRAPKSNQWEEKDWDWAIERIAKKAKETRDANYEQVNEQGVTVNRTMSMAHFGSAALETEENYLFHKFARSLGLVNIDHHARL